jgi:hypothetical protein
LADLGFTKGDECDLCGNEYSCDENKSQDEPNIEKELATTAGFHRG